MGACAQWRGEIGAYIVGALDKDAGSQVSRHLAACAACRAEYEELVLVRDWLDLLAPPADQRQLPARPAARRRASRTRTRRRLSAAGVVLAAAAAAITITVALLSNSGAPAPTYRAVDTATGVSGHAQLHDTPTGTQIDLTASGLPGNERCILVAVAHRGSDVAGSWGAAYDGSAGVVGTTAFSPNQLIALRIETDTGTLLLSIRV